MHRLLTLTLAAAGFGTSAFAADAIVYNPPAAPAAPYVAAPASNWTGPYIGGAIGYGWADTDLPGIEGDGILGGVHAGYNHDMGGFILGGELEYDFADIDLDHNAGDITGIARLKARAGMDLGMAMPYLAAGGAHATADLTGIGKRDDFGWVAGGGVDVAATENVIIGGEYLYHRFGDFDDTGVDVDVHTLRARASYRF